MVNIDEKKILEAFLEEVRELLDTLNQKLLELENNPSDPEIINEIFRLTHSVKSESALVGYKNISTIAHKMEDIFEKVRRGAMSVTSGIVDSLLAAFDRIMMLLNMVTNGENESENDITDVVNPLLNILNEKPLEKKADNIQKSKQPEQAEESGATQLKINMLKLKDSAALVFSDLEKSQVEEALGRGETFYRVVFHLEDECDMKYPRAYLVYNNFINLGNVLKTIPDVQTETNDDKFSEVELYFLTTEKTDKLVDCAEVDQVDRLDIYDVPIELLTAKINMVGGGDAIINDKDIAEAEDIEKKWAEEMMKSQSSATEPKAESHEEVQKQQSKEHHAQAEKIAQKQTIRVDIERLDELINLVGELIINRSRFVQITDNITDGVSLQDLKTELEDSTNELERISDQMQMKMMQARMIPIGNVFSKFPRMVRDLANSLQKNVHLDIIGENTEIDRTVIELLADPLTHLIRNSIDHGIENPIDREKKGKSREGKVMLKAYQEGSNIYIEVSDDGRGIDIEAVKQKVVESGLATHSHISAMPYNEILNYIFQPGFSTKKEITSVSGRGVGMDVVKTQLEKLRGRIDISTKLGEGTKFTIVLPLTTTIVEALLVNVEKNIFAIPITVVEETLKVHKKEIKAFDDYQVYNLRNETLAIIYLSDLVGMRSREKETDEVFIVVISFERRKIGLVVNDLMGEQDIVIKGLDDVLKNSEGVAGAAVLGDGRISLILDTNTLVKAALREIDKISKEIDFSPDDDGGLVSVDEIYDIYNKNKPAAAPVSPVKSKPVTAGGENVKRVPERSETVKQSNVDETAKKIQEILNDIK